MHLLNMLLPTLLYVMLMTIGCGSGATKNTTPLHEGISDEQNNTITQNPSQGKNPSDPYAHIPKNEALTDAMAVRFLNKATFGAVVDDVVSLRTMGVVAWVDAQLTLPVQKNCYLRKTITLAKQFDPEGNSATIEDYLLDNDTVFNKEIASFQSPRWRTSTWFETVLTADDQLRHKTAYALSQIIVESDFEPTFIRRAEALASYFDILYHHAFGKYSQLLRDISLNSGMSMFLTFNGNRKSYTNEMNVTVFPDENYAREIMQLFSIGLARLNRDGTAQKDIDGHTIPSYTQEDVNALARVFTGWDLKRNGAYGRVGITRGDLTHPVEFSAKYHDFYAKTLLGETIPAGLDGKKDINRALDIIMRQPSVAPYIARNLIMRLTKSNPSAAYITRVADTFRKSNYDIGQTVKAILLDPELWNDLKNGTTIKFKEPLIAYTGFLRAMHAAPFPKWYYCPSGKPGDGSVLGCNLVQERFLFNDPRSYLGQGAGLAPNVFNFYDNSYIPNDQIFKSNRWVATELQIQSDTMLINFSNRIRDNMLRWEKGIIEESYYRSDSKWYQYGSVERWIMNRPASLFYVGRDKMLLDARDEYKVLEQIIDGNNDGDFKNLSADPDYHDDEKALRALIDFEDRKLTGGRMDNASKESIFNALSKQIYNPRKDPENGNGIATKKAQLYHNLIVPLIRAIVTSDTYMTE